VRRGKVLCSTTELSRYIFPVLIFRPLIQCSEGRSCVLPPSYPAISSPVWFSDLWFSAQREGLLSEANIDEEIADPFYAHCKMHGDKLVTKGKKRNFLALQSHVKQFKEDKENRPITVSHGLANHRLRLVEKWSPGLAILLGRWIVLFNASA